MYWTRILGSPALVGVVLLMGCGNGSGTVTLNLTVEDFAPGETPVAVPNAEVCVLDTEDCATTNTDGLAVLTLPGNAETGVTITADGFETTLAAITTDADFNSDQTLTLFSETVAEALLTILGIDYPPVQGIVIASTVFFPPGDSGGIPGATFELTEGTGTEYYVTADGLPSYEITATSSFGSGGFVEVASGVVEIEVGGSPADCGFTLAWPGTTATSIRLPVQEGVVTIGVLGCGAVRVTPSVVGAEVPFDEDPVPLEGAEVCQDGTDNCATTDADGVATLEIPHNVEFAYAVTPPSDYFPLLSPQVSDSDIPLSPNLTVTLNSTLEGFAALVDTEFPPTTGFVSVVMYGNPFPELVGISGVSLELIEGTGEVVYLTEGGLPSTELTETASNGLGSFIEVSEGTVEVGLSGVENCERPYSAWPGAEPTQFRIPSRAGFQTLGSVWCDALE